MRRALALLAAACLIAAVAVPLALASSPRAHAAATSVSVGAKDFKFTLSKKSARHGSFTFRVKNSGDVSHKFKIAGHSTTRIAPGKTKSLTVTLKKRSYTYTCPIDGHAGLGMKGTFRST